MPLPRYPSEDRPRLVRKTASEMGWIRRPDMGPNVWETKGGLLYTHEGEGEPIMLMFNHIGWMTDGQLDADNPRDGTKPQ